jgi:hypothetical protein
MILDTRNDDEQALITANQTELQEAMQRPCLGLATTLLLTL